MNEARSRVPRLIAALVFWAPAALAEEVVYELTIAYEPIAIAGRTTVAMTINGTVPGPILRFTEGDEAVNSKEEDEWVAGAAWVLTRELSVAFQYHSIYGAGAGAIVRF